MAIHPPLLQRGATIGVVTLGSPLPASEIDQRIAFLRSWGFQVITGDYVYADNGYLSGTDEQRAADLMHMFANPEVRLILPTRGGVGVAGILPFLDYRMIAANPKIISGYSDISVLLNVLYQFSNMITLSSLLLIDFKPETPAYNFDQFFGMTSTTVAPKVIQSPPGMSMVGRVPGDVTARIVGGNISSIVDTLGTPYEINTSGKILFLEETHEPVNKVYRLVNHLKLAGKLDDCIGIVMGECTGCHISYGKTYEDLITDFIVPLGKPLLTHFPAAHGTYKAAVPIGAMVNLNTNNATVTVLEPMVGIGM
ncbi:S66 peptidase family protein [Paenibacillus piri]|uniref:LD-carboxypeptidase n=1 Tax=Paenibacillus piri TaxID=2547395 RepID=A0A4R5KQA4_9BACL|nr:LD-carboxypeptidase [Paenibacillus piri]TDF97512.1 LD-carboxypeptidase [Paenibacillus piri]